MLNTMNKSRASGVWTYKSFVKNANSLAVFVRKQMPT